MHICDVCDGKGTWLMSADAHRSEGWVPCNTCGSTGKLSDEKWKEIQERRAKSREETEIWRKKSFLKMNIRSIKEGLMRAFLAIEYDNGGINRSRSEADAINDAFKWMQNSKFDAITLKTYNSWFLGVSEDDITIICCAEETEGLEKLKELNAPEGISDFLDTYFEEA